MSARLVSMSLSSAPRRHARQGEQHDVMVRVEDEQHRRIAAAFADAGGLRAAVEYNAEAFRLRVAPLLRPHHETVWVEPSRVANADSFVPFPGEETRASEHGVIPTQLGQALHELAQLGAVLVPIPIDPTDLVVLTIGVVVSVLRSPEFVAGGEHRRALREQERRQEVLLLPQTQRANFGIVGRPVIRVVPRFTLAFTKASIDLAELLAIMARRMRPERVSRYLACLRRGLA